MRSMKLGFAVAALLLGSTALTTPAFATSNQDHTCQGGHNCNTGGGGDVDVDNYNTAVGVGVGIGHGGQGGQGGQGGKGGEGGKGGHADADATAINFNANIAKGGDAEANNKNNLNHNLNGNLSHNKLENEQEQKQIQGQIQGQAQYSNNQNDNSNSNNADQEVNVNTYNERAPVNTAYAAPLAVGEDTCMGSSSIGAQAVSFGLSIGTTWQDDNCRRLKNSRQMVSLGYHRAATALMCVDADVRQAMIDAGTPCPNGQVAVVAPIVHTETTREYVPMAPVADDRPVRKHRVRKALPPK